MRTLIDAFKKFGWDKRGGLVVTFALVLPVLVSTVGMAVDYSMWSLQRTRLQDVADTTAIAAVRESYMANADPGRVKIVAENIAKSHLSSGTSSYSVEANIKEDGRAVEVILSQPPVVYFSELFFDSFSDIKARALARAAGGGRICVLGLDESAGGTVSLEKRARLTAPKCAVYSNSKNSSGIKSKDGSVLYAELICSAGGRVGGKANFRPEPLTDCPQVDDPLLGRPAPSSAGCDENNLTIVDQARTLYPGVYCGGLSIDGTADVYLRPGIYVMKDGPLEVKSSARIRGEYVGFYLTGDKATFLFDTDTTVDLTAPRDGLLAGLLFFEDRNAKKLRKHKILSNNARNLLGTLYLSQGRLYIDANAPIADKSAYTAIVARRLELYEGPNLYLNANYNQTDVPVPEGINMGGRIHLAE